jgi:hypothetical protein
VVKARPAAGGGRWVEISPERIRGWLDGFYSRHDGAIEQGLVLTGVSNGDTATLYPPPGLADVHNVDTLLARVLRPPRIAVLLARKGAVAAGVADGLLACSNPPSRGSPFWRMRQSPPAASTSISCRNTVLRRVRPPWRLGGGGR